MKEPTKSEKLKWTLAIYRRVLRKRNIYTCFAAIFIGIRALDWYQSTLRMHAGKKFGYFSNYECGYGERLMWLCFLITLIEHGEPSLTDV